MERKKAERTRGIYYLFKENEVVYVGQSMLCEKRIMSHLNSKDFDEYATREIMFEGLDETEATEIIRCQPKYNKKIHKNKLIVSLKGFLKEKNGKTPCGVKKRLEKIYSEGVEPINFKGYSYFKRKDLERININ